MKDYKLGEIVTRGQAQYQVTNLYMLTDDYMEEHDLAHKERVTLTRVSGTGAEEHDFAIVKY